MTPRNRGRDDADEQEQYDAKKLANPPRKKVMGRADITFFIFLSMVSVNVTVYAAIGTSVVGWWIVACLLFLLPSSLIIAELSTAYPYQGGIYAWVHRAFGRHWAARTTYWYWVNVAMWMPSAYLLFTGALQALGWTSVTLFQQTLVCTALVWITVGCGIARLKLGKSVTDASSLTVFVILIVVTIGAFVLCAHRGYTSNHFTLHTMLPNVSQAKLGANRAAVEAARDGELPKVFGNQTRWDTPGWAYVMMGLVATAILLIAGAFIKTENGLFYALFASSSAVFILPYLLMYPSIIRLRKTDPMMKRPFRVPGGQVGLWACVILATGSVLSSLILFLWTPGTPVDWSYTGPLLGFFGVAVVAGEVLVGWSLRKYQGEPAQAAHLPGDQPEAPSGRGEQAA